MKKSVIDSESIKSSSLPHCDLGMAEGEYTCMNCPLKCKSLLHDLSTIELEKLNIHRRTQIFMAGETIYKEGDQPKGLLCLSEGKIKITKSNDSGNELIVDLKRPVDFLSAKSLVMGESYSDSAYALEDSSICIINKDSFFEVLNENPGFSLRLIRFFAKKLDNSENRLLNLTNKHMRARLAEALLLVHNIYGTRDENILNVKLKRSELAALANMIPTNAIRILSEFVKENIIETNRKKIAIVNMNSLKEISKYGYTLKIIDTSKSFT